MVRQARAEGYDDDCPSSYTVGSAERREPTDPPDDYPVAMLWLPDCEAWRGWAMRRVKRQPTATPKRRMGF